MTNVVEVTIDLGGQHLAHYQKVYGEIISEGRTAENDEYIMLQDAEDDKPHRILKRKITSITNAQPSTAELPGG